MASLKKTIEMFELDVSPEAYPKLKHYCQALWEINQDLNLTRHTTNELFVTRDLLDTVELSKLIPEGKEVLDVGSGGGVPGMVLAILRPDIEVALAESVTKRANVLGEIVSELEVPVPIYGARGEHLLDDFRFTTIVARAVGSISKFCLWMEPHWASVDRLLLIKGPKWLEERGEARHNGMLSKLELRKVATYPLGDTEESEGVILQIQHKQSPRVFGRDEQDSAESDPS